MHIGGHPRPHLQATYTAPRTPAAVAPWLHPRSRLHGLEVQSALGTTDLGYKGVYSRSDLGAIWGGTPGSWVSEAWKAMVSEWARSPSPMDSLPCEIRRV